MKKIISLILCVMMVASMLPVSALADEDIILAGDELLSLVEEAVEESAESDETILPEETESPEELAAPEVTESTATAEEELPTVETEQESETLLAASGTCGEDLIWTLSDDGILTISGAGDMTNYSYDYSCPWYSVRSSITSVIIQFGVTSIGKNAFSGCNAMTSVSIPDSVTSIGWGTFYGCSSLTSVSIPDGVTSISEESFRKCNNLTAITVDSENTVYTDVDGVLFNKSCTELVCCPGGKDDEYTISESVISIGDYAFFECARLTNVNIPESVISIGDYAFFGCTSLTSITIPNSVTSIGGFSFSGCNSLTNVKLSTNLAIIGQGAFSNASSLSSISFPDGISSIKNSTFSGCSRLSEVILPDRLYEIGDYAFANCTSLTNINQPSKILTIGYEAFCNCTNLTTLPFSESTIMREIGSRAFSNCDNLTSVTFPKSLTDTGGATFHACDNLTEITIPDGIITIGVSTFWLCSNLTSVFIPDSVTTIQTEAFSRCGSLSDVYYSGTEEQWSSIAVGDNNADLLNATIHYNSNSSDSENGDDTEDTGEELESYCWWSFDETDSVLSVIGSGVMENYELDSSGICSSPSFEHKEKTLIMEVGDGIKSIGSYAFYDCRKATDVYIPATVTEIGEAAFMSCTSLSDVYYAGTESQWDAIILGEGNDALLSATVHYNSDPLIKYQLKAYANYGTSMIVGKKITIGLVLYKNGVIQRGWEEPTIVIGNGDVIALDLVDGLDFSGGYLYSVSGLSGGTSSITFTDGNSGAYVTATIEVLERPTTYSYYMNEVPQFYPDALGDEDTLTNFYNFHNLYINNYSCSELTIMGYHVTMDVYNHGYSYAAIDIYDADGNWINSERIDKFTSLTSVIEVGESLYYLVDDWFFEDAFFSYTAHTFSTKTNLDFYVPDGGYFTISNNVYQSPGAYTYNMVDLLMFLVFNTATLYGDVSEYQDAYVKALTASDVVDSFTDELADLASEWTDALATNSLTAIYSQTDDALNFFQSLMDELDIGMSIISSIGGVAESALLEMFSSITAPLKLYFTFAKCGDSVTQAATMFSSGSKPSIQIFCPFDYKSSTIDGITVIKNDGFKADNAVLQVYRVYSADDIKIATNESEDSFTLPVENYQLYNIAFVKDDTNVSFEGTVTVNIKVPERFSAEYCYVYRQEPDGSWTKMDSYMLDDCIVFTTEHFSLYCLAHRPPCADVLVDAAVFPDEAFRAYITDNFDTDEDDVLSAYEIEAVTYIDCGSSGITSLNGIEVFTNLETLHCGCNDLTELDVSNLVSLVELDCWDNNLIEINISGCKNLKVLRCNGNELTSLDVSQNPELVHLLCYNNHLTELNLWNNPHLVLTYQEGEESISNGICSYYREVPMGDGSTGIYTYYLDVDEATMLNFFSWDVNGDSSTNGLDLVAILKHVVGAEDAENSDAIDFNVDGKVDILDVIRLVRYLAGII